MAMWVTIKFGGFARKTESSLKLKHFEDFGLIFLSE